MDTSSLVPIIDTIARQARQASYSLMSLSTAKKNDVLLRIAALLETETEYIQAENDKDLRLGREKGLSAAMLNRLELSDAVIASMIAGLREVCALPDPVGAIREMVKRPNGLLVGRMRVPLGVIAMIYESRPNVTIDAAAEFTKLLQTRISPIRRSGRSSSCSAARAPRLPSRARWRSR